MEARDTFGAPAAPAAAVAVEMMGGGGIRGEGLGTKAEEEEALVELVKEVEGVGAEEKETLER